MDLSRFETVLKDAVAQKDVPGASVTAVVKTAQGVETYAKSFGQENVGDDAPLMKMDSLLWIASCTKLITAICAMQLIEKEVISLDEPLSGILPEYAPPIPLVITPPGDRSKLEAMSSTDVPLTLRRLLTHTSGLLYPHHPELQAWKKTLPEDSPYHPSKVPGKRNILLDYWTPLCFVPSAPGRWSYGTGIDWTGKVIERVNPEGLTLGQYMQKHVFEPLGMKSSTFRPLSDPRLVERLMTSSQRLENGKLIVAPADVIPHIEPVDDSGGGGLYSTAEDYIKVLASLLLDDGKLLSSSSVAELLRPQLPDHPQLQATLAQNDDAKCLAEMETEGDVKSGTTKWNWSLAGHVAIDGVRGKCDEETNFWSGLANTFWWIDRKHGTAGFWGSQIYPWADPEASRLYAKFQKSVYAAAGRP